MAGGETKYVVLDRNPDTSTASFNSVYTRGPVNIDGDFNDWPAQDSMVFINGNNRIRARSMWDKDHLYFAVHVKDENLQVNAWCSKVDVQVAPVGRQRDNPTQAETGSREFGNFQN